jgi:hypothetical protein
MKALVASSVAVVFCLLVLVPSALAQGENYYCVGPFNICYTYPCAAATGTCPDYDMPYAGESVTTNQMTTTCDYGQPKDCMATMQVKACTTIYYQNRSHLGVCSTQCGIDNLVALVCQLP